MAISTRKLELSLHLQNYTEFNKIIHDNKNLIAELFKLKKKVSKRKSHAYFTDEIARVLKEFEAIKKASLKLQIAIMQDLAELEIDDPDANDFSGPDQDNGKVRCDRFKIADIYYNAGLCRMQQWDFFTVIDDSDIQKNIIEIHKLTLKQFTEDYNEAIRLLKLAEDFYFPEDHPKAKLEHQQITESLDEFKSIASWIDASPLSPEEEDTQESSASIKQEVPVASPMLDAASINLTIIKKEDKSASSSAALLKPTSGAAELKPTSFATKELVIQHLNKATSLVSGKRGEQDDGVKFNAVVLQKASNRTFSSKVEYETVLASRCKQMLDTCTDFISALEAKENNWTTKISSFSDDVIKNTDSEKTKILNIYYFAGFSETLKLYALGKILKNKVKSEVATDIVQDKKCFLDAIEISYASAKKRYKDSYQWLPSVENDRKKAIVKEIKSAESVLEDHYAFIKKQLPSLVIVSSTTTVELLLKEYEQAGSDSALLNSLAEKALETMTESTSDIIKNAILNKIPKEILTTVLQTKEVLLDCIKAERKLRQEKSSKKRKSINPSDTLSLHIRMLKSVIEDKPMSDATASDSVDDQKEPSPKKLKLDKPLTSTPQTLFAGTNPPSQKPADVKPPHQASELIKPKS